jgi:hypothetical protein
MIQFSTLIWVMGSFVLGLSGCSTSSKDSSGNFSQTHGTYQLQTLSQAPLEVQIREFPRLGRMEWEEKREACRVWRTLFERSGVEDLERQIDFLWEFPGQPESYWQWRAAIREWLRTHSVSEDSALALLLEGEAKLWFQGPCGIDAVSKVGAQFLRVYGARLDRRTGARFQEWLRASLEPGLLAEAQAPHAVEIQAVYEFMEFWSQKRPSDLSRATVAELKRGPLALQSLGRKAKAPSQVEAFRKGLDDAEKLQSWTRKSLYQ